MNITIVLCEGPHDVAFLSRVMRANDFKSYNKVISEYPQFLKEYISGQFQNQNVNEVNLSNAKNSLHIPSIALSDEEDHLLLLFSMGGDSKKDSRINLIKSFSDLFSLKDKSFTNAMIKDNNLTIIYEFDADKQGINERINKINKELKEEIGFNKELTHLDYTEFNNIKWGAMVFADATSGYGRLEDMILPLIIKGNEDLAEAVDNILNNKDNFNLFKQNRHIHHDKEKAKIGMMGQLDKCGSASFAIIDQSKLIKDEDIKSDKQLCKIVNFISRSFNS